MATDLSKPVQMYQQGAITINGLALQIVEGTQEAPTAEFDARVPVEVLDVIRSQARLPADTEWVHIESCCALDVEAWQTAKREALERWLHGLAFWRAYFGFTS